MARCSRSYLSLPRVRLQQYGLQLAVVSRRYALLADNNISFRGTHPSRHLSAKASDSRGPTDSQTTPISRLTGPKLAQFWQEPHPDKTKPKPKHELTRKHEPKRKHEAETLPMQRRLPVKEQPKYKQLAEALKSTQTLWDSNAEPLLSSILLRDVCRCDQCVDPSTKQRNFSFVDIPENVRALQGGRTKDGKFIVKWENDISNFTGHTSYFSLDELEALAKGLSMTILPDKEPPQSWDTSLIAGRLLTMSYEDYMTSDMHLLTVLKALQRDGLVFVREVPPSTESVNRIVERIGPIRNTFYGSTWDVKSKPSADNVAYTDRELGFHMDLLYMKLAPKYQFLHCIQNTCTGGESRFLDTTQARQIMTADHPEQARILETLRTRYHYQNKGHAYVSQKAVFGPNAGTVLWSPPFVERFQRIPQAPESLRETLLAAKVFASILEREDLVYETKMEEGTCAIFENTRVVHARNAFDVNSGHRWLRGAYLDGQPLSSMYIRLMRQEEANGKVIS